MRSSCDGKLERSYSEAAHWPDEEQEMLVLSTKDRDRLKVLHEVKGEQPDPLAAA